MRDLEKIHRKIEKCDFGPGEEKEFTDTLEMVTEDTPYEKGMYIYREKTIDPMTWFIIDMVVSNSGDDFHLIHIINEVGDGHTMTPERMANVFMYDRVGYNIKKRNEKLQELGI